MSDYTMDISGKIELSDYSNIADYLNIIDKHDNFIIRINKKNKADIDVINSLLSNNKFSIMHAEYDSKGNYCIRANRNR